MTKIDPKLLAQLACPACENRPPVKEDPDGLFCAECGRVYPIKDGIPVMLIDEALQREPVKPSSGN